MKKPPLVRITAAFLRTQLARLRGAAEVTVPAEQLRKIIKLALKAKEGKR